MLFRSRKPLVTVLRLHGVIGRAGPMRAGLSLASLAGRIDQAFRPKRLDAVALSINSPGGSPVQSALIFRRIRERAREKNVPVLAFAEDVAASGGYWLACAGDELYADENSIVGSIGVVSGGFGFTEAMKKLGVERRLYTAGKQKGMLDPFQPEQEQDLAVLREIQGDIHASFQRLVKNRRGKKLKAPEEDLFSGRVWTGKQGVDIGLIDGLGDLRTVARDRFGPKVRLQVVEARKGWVRRRFGMMMPGAPTPELGASLANGAFDALEERAWWARYGL